MSERELIKQWFEAFTEKYMRQIEQTVYHRVRNQAWGGRCDPGRILPCMALQEKDAAYGKKACGNLSEEYNPLGDF